MEKVLVETTKEWSQTGNFFNQNFFSKYFLYERVAEAVASDPHDFILQLYHNLQSSYCVRCIEVINIFFMGLTPFFSAKIFRDLDSKYFFAFTFTIMLLHH